MKTLPPRLRIALEGIVKNQGDDIYFVLGYVSGSTARSYVSQLKARGLAFTYRSNGATEVWAHEKGRNLIKAAPPTPHR